jgi:hypothetical protein
MLQPALVLDGRPFTVDAAADATITIKQLRGLVGLGLVRRVFRGGEDGA